jgi:hypothetical protein
MSWQDGFITIPKGAKESPAIDLDQGQTPLLKNLVIFGPDELPEMVTVAVADRHGKGARYYALNDGTGVAREVLGQAANEFALMAPSMVLVASVPAGEDRVFRILGKVSK